MNTYFPAIGWVAVKREEISERTAGGVIKPPSAIEAEKAAEGQEAPTFLVIAVPNADNAVGVEHLDVGVRYPAVGAHVVVGNRAAIQVAAKPDIFLVRLDTIASVVLK